MKGFLVVDRLNDIHFIDTDKEFARHTNEQAKESGLLPDDYTDMYLIDPNIVMQQFSPLIMSQWFMIDHMRKPCSSITCENNFLFVFKQFDDLLIISINGDGTESEDFLTRKNLVFIRMSGFLTGPVTDEIGKPKFTRKTEQWQYLRLLLSTWTYLAKNEQSFLVEAIEKLNVNQVVNEQCIEVLQAAVAKIQEAGDSNTQHALLLVNSKLLSLYSNRNAQELQSADILCMIILVRSLFPTHDKLEDLFAQSYRPTDGSQIRLEAQSPATVKVPGPHRDRYESTMEDFYTGDDTDIEYFSSKEGADRMSRDDSSGSILDGDYTPDKMLENSGARKTPYPEVSERYFTPTTSPTGFRQEEPEREAQFEKTITPASEVDALRPRSHTDSEVQGSSGVIEPHFLEELVERGRSRSLTEHQKRDHIFKKFERESNANWNSDSDKEHLLCSERSSSETHLPPPPETEREMDAEITVEDSDYVKRAVFLSTPVCKYSPYQIHCRRIYPGIILVILSEMPKLRQAPKLVQLLQLLKDLMNEHRDNLGRSQGQRIYDVINSQLNSVLLSLKKAKGRLEQLCKDIRKKWESEDVRGGLIAYLEQGTRMISPTLERSLKALHNKFMEMFLCLYLSPRPITPPQMSALTTITELFVRQLGDYKDYLTVKAQRNITMTTYIEEFPGLVHFIYVNRRTNQIMAPALNITHRDDSTSHDATQLLKDKIWGITEWMQRRLHEGYMSVTAREGDYHFSYFLWFENCTGEPQVVQKAYRPDPTAPPPGILTGNFFKYITHKCFPNSVSNSVHCNELLMMHVGLANTQYIANHCRQLAANLEETNEQVLSSMSLFKLI